MIAGIQNSQRQPATSTIGPASTMPTPPPTAMTADRMPTIEGTRVAGNSSRTIPNDTGNTAPPRPWMIRAMISTPTLGATAATTQPSAMAASPTSSVRSLPIMSAMRPSSGVATDADSSRAVSTQVTALWLVWRSCWMVDSTGLTRDCSRENEATAAANARKVSRCGEVVRDIEILRQEEPARRGAPVTTPRLRGRRMTKRTIRGR